MSYIIALLSAYWFGREFARFSTMVNQRIYQDYAQLQPNVVSFQQFLQLSTLQPRKPFYAYLLYPAFPLLLAVFADKSEPVQLVVVVLLYLSLLDYCYYLTDSRYIALIFLVGLIQLLFYTPENMQEALLALLILSLFFALFLPLAKQVFKQEAFGLGDVLLLLALTPFFNLPQMLQLICTACLLGLIFALGYFCKFRRKIQRLPFIPFITLAVFVSLSDRFS